MQPALITRSHESEDCDEVSVPICTPVEPTARALGRHVIAEYYGCDRSILDDASALEHLLVTAARRAGATPIKSDFHHVGSPGTELEFAL